ncbi:hypothetical protein G159_02195 [Planococcus glaciei CHR43]|uniref:hypothetical protein n=1 Tax=Planococcus glaciei TaxID=459472 RepID=UPI0003DF3137|nr:hypothetical protein [Planococcus glaciei]ETP70362.1 hypothetical protein G159_02195 [Planococcus glaciei CHR43]
MAADGQLSPKAAVHGTANGVFFMAIFGALWAYTGIMGLQKPAGTTRWLLAIAVLVGVGFCVAGFLLMRSARRFPGGGQKPGKRHLLKFNLIFAAEGVSIATVNLICNATGNLNLLPILVAVIVGLHFLPLASLFRVKLYYATGLLLCLLALFTWFFIPENLVFGGDEANAYMVIVGFGSALILWVTAFHILGIGRKIVHEVKKAPVTTT